MSKYTAFLMLLILSISIAFPASASVCRNYNGHQICILSIKRSAKNYWEYRAAVSVDGVAQATKVYDCRQQQNLSSLSANRVKTQKGGTSVPLGDSESGKMICNFFK
ncbi:MAG: hypothetical protein F6K36_27725 [Symploca sp. SIO3C6]|nr:hypothetical protein [Symploca sp. SIO3C6]NET05462.1 hypothetical protein [Symploca sp. SIO2B6]